VQVAFDSDPEKVMELLKNSALVQPRVLKDPGPSVQLSQFAADGLEFTLVYWINDLHNGQGNLRSDVNVAILGALRAHGIQMNVPARVAQLVNSASGHWVV